MTIPLWAVILAGSCILTGFAYVLIRIVDIEVEVLRLAHDIDWLERETNAGLAMHRDIIAKLLAERTLP